MKARHLASVLLAFAGTFCAVAQQTGPAAFTSDGKLLRPADYRSWIHLGSSLGLQYSNGVGKSRPPSFENVYVNPSSWREFEKTGKWPDGTVFFLEIRLAMSKGSFAVGGQYQGEVTATELEVKDSRRFPDGWAWFNLPLGAPAATPFEKKDGCFACHTANGAVEKTFAQFYPTAMEIAKEKGTVNESYRKMVDSKAFEK